MTQETEPSHDHDSAADVGHDVDDGRTTAPMSEYEFGAVRIGFVILVVGSILAFGVPILATL